ncbi:hypothetical protein THAOC_32356, partial [Thalassiosira oceanica]
KESLGGVIGLPEREGEIERSTTFEKKRSKNNKRGGHYVFPGLKENIMPAASASAAASSSLRRRQELGTKIVRCTGEIVRGRAKKTERADKSPCPTTPTLSRATVRPDRRRWSPARPTRRRGRHFRSGEGGSRGGGYGSSSRRVASASTATRAVRGGDFRSSQADLSYVERATASVGDGSAQAEESSAAGRKTEG